MGNCNSYNKKKIHNLYYVNNPLNLYCYICYQKIERNDVIRYTDCCFKPTHISCLDISNRSYICPYCKVNNKVDKIHIFKKI